MNKLVLVYDDWCPYCTRFSRFVKRNDVFNRVSFLKLREDRILIEGFDKNMALKKMASLKKENWRYGFESIWRISKEIPFFWILTPVLFILRLTKIGELLYNELAIKRKIIPIHCNENCKIDF